VVGLNRMPDASEIWEAVEASITLWINAIQATRSSECRADMAGHCRQSTAAFCSAPMVLL
jgi:hypothetical protein